MMNEFKGAIGRLCGVNTCCEEERDSGDKEGLRSRRADGSNYKVIFTSCASEANCTVIAAAVDSFTDTLGGTALPHVVASAVEHKSIIEQLHSLESRGRIEVTFVGVAPSGHVLPKDVLAAIRPNTCLVVVMHANNETGAVNDIAEIGRIAHSKNVPMHTDTVQSFGKYPIKPVSMNVDSFCISFHKFQGPPGVGALVIKQQFLDGWRLPPLIFGSQNEGLRGGTENLPGIGASYEALKLAMEDRLAKNAVAGKIRVFIMDEIAKAVPTVSYSEYLNKSVSGGVATKNSLEVVWLSGGPKDAPKYLPGTILLSVVKRTGEPACNIAMKNHLETRGIIISVGSACNTASPKASHVLYALGADALIRKGALRVSIGDVNTIEDGRKFVHEFLTMLKDTCSKKK